MKPRIVCVGSNLESEIALKKLIDEGVNIVGLVTLPPGAASGVSDYRDLHSLAQQSDISVIDTNDINSAETLKELEKLQSDYLFVLGWSQILKEQTLSIIKGFVVGSHPTPLPKRRGRAPIPWTILAGESKSAVTLFKMTSKIDDGAILVQKHFEILGRPNAMDVYLLAAKALSEAFYELYRQLLDGRVAGIEQSNEEVSYRGKRTPQDGLLDFSMPALDIDCLVRAVSAPYPGAYFYYKGDKVLVWESELYEGPERVGIPGQILAKRDGYLIVRTIEDCVLLRSFEAAGKVLPLSHFKLGDVLNHRVDDEIYELKKRVAHLEGLLACQDKGKE